MITQSITVNELLNNMYNSMIRMEQKIDYILLIIETEESDYDDANIMPFGKERDGSEPL